MSSEFNIGLNTRDIEYFEKKVHKRLRVESLADQLASATNNAAVQRITELKNTKWGYQAVMTLVPDDTTFGVVGDNRLKDHERGITSHDLTITFDQFRKAHKNEGRMADRSSWVKFLGEAYDQLSFWAVDIKNRLMMNVLSGIAFDYELNGADRESQFPQCRFAGDVSAPSGNRHLRWDVDTANTLQAGNTAAVAATDLPTWNMFVDVSTELPMMRVKPIRGMFGFGKDTYVALVHPRTMGHIRKDSTFQTNWREALARGEKNPLFAGADTYYVDGILIISHRYVYTTLAAASGTAKWGAGADVDGTRTLFLGAQALGMVEMGSPIWTPDDDDYKNVQSIAMALMFGFRKTVWPDPYVADSDEDFGVVAVDHAIPAGATSYTM